MIIAGAGGAAHLPGMVASMSPLPVIGVPVEISIRSTVGTVCCRFYKCQAVFPQHFVALNGGKNAGI